MNLTEIFFGYNQTQQKVIMLRLIVTESDYIYSSVVNAFVLQERESGPGNPAHSPAEGATLYNAWIAAGCPNSDALSDFEKLVNYSLSNEAGSRDTASYLLYVMGCDGVLTKELPKCGRWSMQLLFARNSLDSMERASFLALRNALIKRLENE